MKRDDVMSMAERLQRLFSGTYAPTDSCDLFVAPGASRAAAAGALAALAAEPDPVAFVPASLERELGTFDGVCVCGYEGELDGDEELLVGGAFPLALVGYAASAYVPFTAPTVIDVANADDYAFFLEDADAAVAEGRFPEQLTHPVAVLGDRCGLAGGAGRCGGGRGQRRFLGEDGQLRPSLHGAPTGDVTPGCRCLAEEIGQKAVREAAGTRPWLARYLVVLESLGALRQRELASLSASGFGGRLATSAPAEPIEDPDSLVILHDDAGSFTVVDPLDRRVFRVGRDLAIVLEALTTAPASAAADPFEAVAVSLAITTARARDVVERVRPRLPARALAVLAGA